MWSLIDHCKLSIHPEELHTEPQCFARDLFFSDLGSYCLSFRRSDLPLVAGRYLFCSNRSVTLAGVKSGLCIKLTARRLCLSCLAGNC